MFRKKTSRNRQTKYLYNITITTILYLSTEINCCVVTPRELLATVGEVVSLGCNAKPSNDQQSTVSNLKLENESKNETTIFKAPVYGARGKLSIKEFVAEGYFLSELNEDLFNATIQINETQLKHGGRYVCSCSTGKDASTTTGSGNLVVLADKLSFGLNRGNSQTPGETLLDLNCSFSFSGSISSAVSVDLTIQDANGTELAAKRNLSLSWRSQLGSHYVNYSFIAQRNTKEQNFTCQMKAWNQSSSRLLRSMTANYRLNSGHMTISLPYSWSGVTPATAFEASTGLAVGVVVGLLVLVVIAAVVLFIKRDKLSTCNGNSTNFVAQKCSTSTRRVRYEGGKPFIEHPTEYNRQKNKMGADNEVFVVDNDIYDASQGRNEPTDDHKAEQIYNEIC